MTILRDLLTLPIALGVLPAALIESWFGTDVIGDWAFTKLWELED